MPRRLRRSRRSTLHTPRTPRLPSRRGGGLRSRAVDQFHPVRHEPSLVGGDRLGPSAGAVPTAPGGHQRPPRHTPAVRRRHRPHLRARLPESVHETPLVIDGGKVVHAPRTRLVGLACDAGHFPHGLAERIVGVVERWNVGVGVVVVEIPVVVGVRFEFEVDELGMAGVTVSIPRGVARLEGGRSGSPSGGAGHVAAVAGRSSGGRRDHGPIRQQVKARGRGRGVEGILVAAKAVAVGVVKVAAVEARVRVQVDQVVVRLGAGLGLEYFLGRSPPLPRR
mmetsp:Transcript_47095/g.142620  ORF Transcript_47095/g.142620 Transcript_47095/m.142620 type:complete len:279 (+) Transcript_47095:104-940(+)